MKQCNKKWNVVNTSHGGATCKQDEILGVTVKRITSVVVATWILPSQKPTRYPSFVVATRQTLLDQYVSSLHDVNVKLILVHVLAQI